MKESEICTACGTQYPGTSPVPEVCNICTEERQYVPARGQIWTTRQKLLATHRTQIRRINDRVYELEINPRFAIGQRAFFIISERGNVLWDCIPLLDDPTVDFIKAKGGLSAIAFSHPHYYSNMNEWANAFDSPIYIHQHDEEWVMNKSPRQVFWQGTEKALWNGIRIINIGGHFRGSSVLQVPFLSKEGVLFCGDTVYISPSKRHMAVMYSYPNRIPLPVEEVKRIQKRFDEISFDTMYGFLSFQNIVQDAKQLLKSSLDRYI